MPIFEDASEDAGVLFFDGGGGLSVQMGGGTAWFDFDGDGDDDLFVTHAEGDNRLFRNDGGAFEDVSAGAGLATVGARDPLGASPADFDQDGRCDVYVTTTSYNMLLRNMGGGLFKDVAKKEAVTGGEAFSTAASWADFDLDGDLELYVGNYVREPSFPYQVGEPNHLFVNPGKSGGSKFIERAAELGVSNEGVFGPSDPAHPEFVSPEGQPTAGLTLSVATLDYDDDGRPDLQLGNDFGAWVLPNALYRNATTSGELAFEDVSAATGFDQRPHYDMGISASDFDHDGDWDFYLSNLGDNLLLRNEGGVFVDEVYALGPVEGWNPESEKFVTSWATVWRDLDNDTFDDLFVVNGLIPTHPLLANDIRQPNAVWKNIEGEYFLRLPDWLSGAGDAGPGRGAGACDVDGDGLLDVYTTNNRQIPQGLPEDANRLWRSAALGVEGKHWLALRLRGRHRLSNADGIGARLEAHLGELVLKRQVLGDTVYLSSSSREAHFGLGDAERVDRVVVRWPSGLVQELLDVASGQRLALTEPVATVASVSAPLVDAGTLTAYATCENYGKKAVAGSLTLALLPAGGAAAVPLGELELVLPTGASTVELTAPFGATLPVEGAELVVSLLVDGCLDQEVQPLAGP
ncbi:MAG: CRTAC1 family protein [Planctomycetota bacterium]